MRSNHSPHLLDATQSLIENLLASEAFIRYEQASACLDADARAHGKLNELSRAQARLRQDQADGGVTRADVEALRALQEEVQRNAVIMEHTQAQQAAVSLLREVNTEISQLLGVDFAFLANHQTC